MSIFTPKNSDDFFKSSTLFVRFFLFFSDFPFSISLLHIFTGCNVIYDPSSREKSTFLNNFLMTLCSCFRAHPTNTTSQNNGERMHRPSPPQIFWGTVPPVPLGLRPWPLIIMCCICGQRSYTIGRRRRAAPLAILTVWRIPVRIRHGPHPVWL